MKLTENRFFAALAASIVLMTAVLAERMLVLRACGGEYVYPLDDTYIHMAIAKTLAQHGVWGVEPDKMAFCSSSPLWTILLSGLYFLFGVGDRLPWMLAAGFNLASLFVVCQVMRRSGAGVWVQIAGSLVVAAFGTFVSTTALGMEHAMHAFFLLASTASAERLVASWTNRRTWATCLLATLATASRYESLFFLLPLSVGICMFEAFYRWRNKDCLVPLRGLAVGIAAVFPVFAYGIWALLMGGHFLPNSLLLKGSFRTIPEIFSEIYHLLMMVRPGCGYMYLLAAALTAAAVMRRTPPFWRLAAVSAIVAVGGQFVFADLGQLARYEAYLVAMGALVVVMSAIRCKLEQDPLTIAAVGVFIITAGVFLTRAERYFSRSIHASSDICNQQVLMTNIMSELPAEDKGCIALNDLGYMAMYGRFPIVDLWGLGSQDATELILRHPGELHASDCMQLMANHQVKYVVVYEAWIPLTFMPSGTVDVAKLTLKDNYICGKDTVVFRATSRTAADRLALHLGKYVSKMPPRAELRVLHDVGTSD